MNNNDGNRILTFREYALTYLALLMMLCAGLIVGYEVGYTAHHPMTYTQHVDNRNYTCTLTVDKHGQVFDNCRIAG
jgi:hypothetical protein